MSTPEELLKMRLAEGKIGLDEFNRLLGAIRGTAPPMSLASPPHEFAQEKLLAQAGDLNVFQTYAEYRGRRIPLASIASVQGGTSSTSINLIRVAKESRLHFSLASGETFLIEEKRTFLGGKSHESIAHATSLLKQLTIRYRVNAFASKLRQAGSATLSTSTDPVNDVVLRRDGHVQQDEKQVNLKLARASGTLTLGTYFTSLSGASYVTNPDEILLCEKKLVLGTTWFNEVIRFVPNVVDPDVTHYLIGWLSEPERSL